MQFLWLILAQLRSTALRQMDRQPTSYLTIRNTICCILFAPKPLRRDIKYKVVKGCPNQRNHIRSSNVSYIVAD